MKSEPEYRPIPSEREGGMTLRGAEQSIRDLEARLRKSEERFRATFEQAAVGITHVSPEGRFLRINDKFCDIVGYTRDEMLARTFQDITHPDDIDADIDHVQQLLRGESDTYSMEKRYFRKNGETVWVNLTVNLLRDDAGEPSWFVSVVEDITEKKKVQQERDRILTLSQDLICIVGMDGKFKYVNPAWECFLGYPEEELLARPFLDFIHPDDRDRSARELESLAAGYSTFDSELRGVSNDGTIRHISWAATPVADENLIYCIGRDVTERKRADKALIDSRKRLIKAEEVARMGFLDMNLKTNELVWSREVYDLYGIDPQKPVTIEQTIGLVHPDDREFVNENLNMAIQGVVEYDIDHRMVRPDGKVIWVHARADMERDSEGIPTSLMGTVVDITERKLVEEKLLKSEGQFRALMEQSPLAIEILTPKGQITQVNTAWMRMWDVNEEETAQVLSRYNMLADKQIKNLGILPLVERAFAGQRVVLPPIEYDGMRAAKEMGLEGVETRSLWIQCHLFPVKDANQQIQFVVNTYVDITEIKLAEEESRKHQDALARIDRAKSLGQLTGSIAHELNQPLTGILSNAQAAELLIKSGRSERAELEEILAEIVADTKRGGKVIQNLRELYREQKGEFLPVDINAVVDETTQLLHSEFVLQHVVLTTECASPIPVASGNRIQLQQVLVNLIMNGIQSMGDIGRENRRLHVATAHETNELKAWVEDCGPGIDIDKIDRIFEPLATWKPGGTGMGLAISNSIIQSHSGRMWAENRPGGGARVGFALPVPKEGQQI